VPPRGALQVQHVQILGRQTGGADAALDDDHVPDSRRGVRRPGARALARGLELTPNPGADVEAVHIRGGAGEA
jgi:hypothetical protein